MSEPTIRFYWDIGSTNTYFAFHLLRPLAAKYKARIEYVPLNLGYVFRHHGAHPGTARQNEEPQG